MLGGKIFNRETGRMAEEAAGRYLEGLGYEVIMRNYHTRYGEIDLICRNNNILVFIEVKAKRGGLFGRPEEMFTRYKYEKVKRMGEVYLKGKNVPCRIDMVAVELDGDNVVKALRHYPGVVLD